MPGTQAPAPAHQPHAESALQVPQLCSAAHRATLAAATALAQDAVGAGPVANWPTGHTLSAGAPVMVVTGWQEAVLAHHPHPVRLPHAVHVRFAWHRRALMAYAALLALRHALM